MLSAGCDLHKQTITICVVNQMRIVILRRTLACADEEAIRRFFEELRQREPFTVVVEATASYEWFVIQTHAAHVTLTHVARHEIVKNSIRTRFPPRGERHDAHPASFSIAGPIPPVVDRGLNDDQA